MPRTTRLAILAAATLALHGAPGLAAGEQADRSLAELARASLSAAASHALQGAETVATFALSLVGIDYRWGGATPAQGFDCSGLIRYVFQETTGAALPRTARGLATLGSRVTRNELAPGDLVFFNTRHAAFSHVGIYLGDDRFIHASGRGGEVGVAMLSAAYWKKRYDGARRLIGVLPALMPQVVAKAWATDADSAPPATSNPTLNAAPNVAPNAAPNAAPVSQTDAATASAPAMHDAQAPADAGAPIASHLSDDQP